MKGLSKTKVKPILNNQQHSKQIQPPVGEQYKKVVDIPAVRSHFGSIAVDAGRVQVCTYGRLLHGQMRSECKQDEGCSMCPNWMQKIRALPGTVRDNVLSFLMLPLSSIYIPMRTLQDFILLGARGPIGRVYAAVTERALRVYRDTAFGMWGSEGERRVYEYIESRSPNLPLFECELCGKASIGSLIRCPILFIQIALYHRWGRLPRTDTVHQMLALAISGAEGLRSGLVDRHICVNCTAMLPQPTEPLYSVGTALLQNT